MNDAGKRLIAAAKESALTALRAHLDDLEAERDALLLKNEEITAERDALRSQNDALMRERTSMIATHRGNLALAEKAHAALVDAVARARDTAMQLTIEARVPECGKFGEIAQDLDWALPEIVRLSAEVERLLGQDWQPIETAPTDGTLCLWWDDSFRAVRLGRFRDGYFFWGGLLEARSAIPSEPTDTGFTHWRLPPRPPLAEPPH